MSRPPVIEPTVRIRGLAASQVQELVDRLQAAVVRAETMRGIHGVYAAEANAYRQALATIDAV